MSRPDQPPGVDELLDRALRALAAGHRATANRLAEQVLAVDRHNPDAEDLLAAPADPGEIRRLTVEELMRFPQPEWRPIAANPSFLGVSRWNILRTENDTRSE